MCEQAPTSAISLPSSGLSTGAIAGIAVGAVVMLVVCAFVAISVQGGRSELKDAPAPTTIHSGPHSTRTGGTAMTVPRRQPAAVGGFVGNPPPYNPSYPQMGVQQEGAYHAQAMQSGW